MTTTPERSVAPGTAEMVTIVRAAVLAADPAIAETVKWNAPNFVAAGVDRVTLRLPPRGGLQVIFHRGAVKRTDLDSFSFPDPTGRLAWPAPDRGVLSLVDPADARASAAAITGLVAAWIAVD